MQAFVSNLKEVLLNWNSITIHSPLVSAVIIGVMIALMTWFLLSRYYRAKMGKVRAHCQQQLTAAEQEQLQVSDVLASTVEQLLDTETELSSQKQLVQQLEHDNALAQVTIARASELEKNLAQDLQTLQSNFFFSQPLPAISESNVSTLWQQHSSVVNELVNRLKTTTQEQLALKQEKSKQRDLLAGFEVTVQEMNQKMATQAAQLAKLEHDFETQQARVVEQQAQQEQLSVELVLAKEEHAQALLQQAELIKASVKPLQTEALPVINEPVAVAVNDEQVAVIDDVIAQAAHKAPAVAAVSASFKAPEAQILVQDVASTRVSEPLESVAITPALAEQASVADASVTKLKSFFSFSKKSEQETASVPPADQDEATLIAPESTDHTLSVEVEPTDAIESFIHQSEHKVESLFNTLKSSFKSNKTPALQKDVEDAVTSVAAEIAAVETSTTVEPMAKLKNRFSFGKKDEQDVVKATQPIQDATTALLNTDAPVTVVTANVKSAEDKKPSMFNAFKLGKKQAKVETLVIDDAPLSVAPAIDVSVKAPVLNDVVVEQDVPVAKLKKSVGFGLFSKGALAEYAEEALEKLDALSEPTVEQETLEQDHSVSDKLKGFFRKKTTEK